MSRDRQRNRRDRDHRHNHHNHRRQALSTTADNFSNDPIISGGQFGRGERDSERRDRYSAHDDRYASSGEVYHDETTSVLGGTSIDDRDNDRDSDHFSLIAAPDPLA